MQRGFKMEKSKRVRPQLTVTVDEDTFKVIDVLSYGTSKGRLIDEAIASYLLNTPFFGKNGIIELRGDRGGYWWVDNDDFPFMFVSNRKGKISHK